MWIFIGMIGFLAFLVFGIMGAIAKLRKKNTVKRNLIISAACLVLFIVGVSNADTETATTDQSVKPAATEQALAAIAEKTEAPAATPTAEELKATEEATKKAEAEKKAKEEAAAKDKADAEAKAKAEADAKAKEASIPREYKAALKSAQSYAEGMHMSKAGIYDQLTSEYGENFPKEAAQYAIDNIVFDWKENALKSARSYAETMSMSDAAIYDQLISEYGEKFTKAEAQYAIDNLK